MHLRAVALDLLTEALHPSSCLKPYILQLATLLWEDSSAVHLLCSATDILPETEALLLQGSAQLSWHLSGICAVSTTSAYHRLCAHMIAYFVALVIQIAGLECFVRGGCHTRHFCEPTWVPSPGAVPSDIACCSEWFEDMAADWFDIDYSAFVYDRDFEEELCIEDFSHDFLEPAPGLVLNAGNRPQASEAWTAQAHHDQPDSASHQYATFFAQTAGAADARVAGDIIDPAEAPVNRRFSLWSGAKRDDRHERRANPAPQQPARKRALQRARRRAIKNGGTWYRDRWATSKDIGLPGEVHDTSCHFAHQLCKCMPKMPALPPWPPKPAVLGSQGPRMPKHGLGVLTSNLGGFSKAGFDEFQRWLHLEPRADWCMLCSFRKPGEAALNFALLNGCGSSRAAARLLGKGLQFS